MKIEDLLKLLKDLNLSSTINLFLQQSEENTGKMEIKVDQELGLVTQLLRLLADMGDRVRELSARLEKTELRLSRLENDKQMNPLIINWWQGNSKITLIMAADMDVLYWENISRHTQRHTAMWGLIIAPHHGSIHYYQCKHYKKN